ncbi:phosphoribosylanthranilate isomerase [Methanobrevibacter sp.]|uniref:phosphoribosylanthranilate isomerase n=1 Tax=Methanobrevibacter sp. TaxID=66852 RepID=UPI003868E959
MAKIKICGIRRMEDIEIVNRYGPDFIGFVFADSKRRVSHEESYRLRQNLDSDIVPVGVFVDTNQDEIVKLFDEGIIEIAQLHGNESEGYILDLKEKTNNELKIIKAIEMNENIDLVEFNSSQADYLLLDSGKGSGKTFDWNLIKNDIKKDFFLAGGLNSSNISQAVAEFDPYAVDLSSGLEVNGFKDELKVKEIMEVIR